MKAQELWNEFCKEKKVDPATPYEAWAFGGDPDGLAYWRKVHEDFFIKDYANYGLTFTKDSRILCEEFELLYLAPTQ